MNQQVVTSGPMSCTGTGAQRRSSLKPASAQTSLFSLFASALIAQGHGLAALGFFFSTTIERVLAEVVRLGLPTPHGRPLRRNPRADAWTSEQIQQLMLLWPTNLYASRIADRIGRSAGSVRYKAKWLGLPPRRRGDLRRDVAGGTDLPAVPVILAARAARRRRKIDHPLKDDVLIGEYHLTGVDHAVTAHALNDTERDSPITKRDVENRSSSLQLPSRHFMRGRLNMEYKADRPRLAEFQTKQPWVLKKCLSGRRWFFSNDKGERFAKATKKTKWFRDRSGGGD